MKKRRLAKIMSLLLITILLCAVVQPAPAQASRPKSFNIARISNTEFPTVQVIIGDMGFHGWIRPGYSDEELDKLIEEVLKEMGLTEAEFDLLNEPNRPLTQQEINDIRDALVTAAALADAAGADGLGTAAQIGKLIHQLRQGDFKGAAGTLYDMAPTSVPGLNPISSWRFGAEIRHMLLEIWKYATDSAGPVNEFYKRLKEKINDLDKGWVIEVNTEIPRTGRFNFYSRYSFKEKWTLNMTLTQLRRHGTWGYEGQYNGSYTIEIEYDIENIHNAFFEPMRDGIMNTPGADIDISEVVLADPGEKHAKRTITGEAQAVIINFIVHSQSITPAQTSDEKDVSISDVVTHIRRDLTWIFENGDTGHMDEEYDFVHWADEQNIYSQLRNYVAVWEYGERSDGPLDAEANIWFVWDSSEMYQRGDNAAQGWQLKIVRY